MSRWHVLNQFWRDLNPRDRVRAVLLVEELEGREVLAPLVTAPFFSIPPATLEGAARVFTSSESFYVTDVGNHNIAATLSSPRGKFAVDPMAASSFGVTVANNGTANVTATGQINSVSAFLQSSGFTFTPNAFYSGDAPINLSVIDLQAPGSGSGSFVLQVLPDASPSALTWAATSEVGLRTGPFAFPPNFLSATPWPDTDGSEALDVSILLSADDPSVLDQFTLTGNGTITQVEVGQWVFSGTSPGAIQALFNSLVLTPPSNFNGRISVTAFGVLRDTASFSSPSGMLTDTRPLAAVSVDLRFFEEARFAIPPVSAQAGAPVDLGGHYSVVDPAELPEDYHTLTISAERGALTFDPARVPPQLSMGRDGNTLLLTGELSAINAFLATPGSFTYTVDDPNFNGPVALKFSLVNHPGRSPSQPAPYYASDFANNGPPPTVVVTMIAITPAPPSGNGPPQGGPPGTTPTTKNTNSSSKNFGQPGSNDGGGNGGPGAPDDPGGQPGGPGGSSGLGSISSPNGVGGPGGPGGPGGGRTPPGGFLGAGGPGGGPHGPGGGRGAPPPGPHHPPFARLDTQPLFAGEAGRHPLPPVLPLDQTSPVAGFSDSAGDSLALVDLIYRDANGAELHPTVLLLGTGPTTPAPAPKTSAPASTIVALTATNTPTETSDAPALESEGISAANWYPLAAGTVAGALAAWLARGRVAALIRSVRRLFRTPTHSRTEGTT